MADKGKRLLILAGLAPRHKEPDADEMGGPSDEDEDNAPPDAASAAQEAMDAAKADDSAAFAKALFKLIDAHAEARSAKV